MSHHYPPLPLELPGRQKLSKYHRGDAKASLSHGCGFPWIKSCLTNGVKEKQRQIALKGGKTDFVQTTAVGERDLQYRTELRSTKVKGRRHLKHVLCQRKILRDIVRWGASMWSGCLCLVIGTYPEEKQTSLRFMTGGSFANWSKAPTQLGSYTHARVGGVGEVSPQFAFHRDGSQILEETFLYGRRLTPQRGRERIYNCKFSNVTPLRKGVSGTYSQGLAGTN